MSDRLVVILGSVVIALLAGVGGTSATQPSPIHALRDDQFAPVPTASIVNILPGRSQPSRPEVVVPTPHLIIVVAPEPTVRLTGHSLSGRASWFCSATSPCFHGYPPGSAVAAAGPALRAAICGVQSCTSWRNRTVLVDGVPVVLRDWCQCGWHQSWEKIIDLYKAIYDKTGGNVTITW